MSGISVSYDSTLMQMALFNRAANDAMSVSMERLSTGSRVNRGVDDPSGLAIGSGMNAQLRGIATAIHNIGEGLDMVHAADSVLSEMQDIYMRIRDLCVKGANQATLSTVTAGAGDTPFCDSSKIFEEIMILQTEVYRTATGVTHNTKEIFQALSPPDGQVLQVGPDNATNNTVKIEIPDLEGLGTPFYSPPPGNLTSAQYRDAFLMALTNADARLDTLSDTRADLGAQENNLNAMLDEMSIQVINLSAAKSDIMDADFAGEVVEMTKANIKSNFSTMALAQANLEPGMVYKLMSTAIGL